MHHLSVMPLRLLNDNDLPASTTELAANRPLAGVILPPTVRAFDEEAHGEFSRRAEYRPPALSISYYFMPSRTSWNSKILTC